MVEINISVGETQIDVEDDGTFSGEVLGRDPTIVYSRTNARGVESPPEGKVVLREGCVDRSEFDPVSF